MHDLALMPVFTFHTVVTDGKSGAVPLLARCLGSDTAEDSFCSAVPFGFQDVAPYGEYSGCTEFLGKWVAGDSGGDSGRFVDDTLVIDFHPMFTVYMITGMMTVTCFIHSVGSPQPMNRCRRVRCTG